MENNYKIPCTECGEEMKIVSNIGDTMQIVEAGEVRGIRSLELWQCPKDKTVRVH